MAASNKAIGLKYGFRSGLEERVSQQIFFEGTMFQYEGIKLPFVQPEKNRKYTPDFTLRKKDGTMMYIETKGRFVVQDRLKHLLIREQYPKLDLRFVFTNPNGKITKTSKTTYAMWCDKHGFRYAKALMPREWLDELQTII